MNLKVPRGVIEEMQQGQAIILTTAMYRYQNGYAYCSLFEQVHETNRQSIRRTISALIYATVAPSSYIVQIQRKTDEAVR